MSANSEAKEPIMGIQKNHELARVHSMTDGCDMTTDRAAVKSSWQARIAYTRRMKAILISGAEVLTLVPYCGQGGKTRWVRGWAQSGEASRRARDAP